MVDCDEGFVRDGRDSKGREGISGPMTLMRKRTGFLGIERKKKSFFCF